MAASGWCGIGWHSPAPAGHVRARMSVVVPAGSRGAARGEEVTGSSWDVSRREGVGSLAATLACKAPYLGGGQGHRTEALLLVVPVGVGEGLHGLGRRVHFAC